MQSEGSAYIAARASRWAETHCEDGSTLCTHTNTHHLPLYTTHAHFIIIPCGFRLVLFFFFSFFFLLGNNNNKADAIFQLWAENARLSFFFLRELLFHQHHSLEFLTCAERCNLLLPHNPLKTDMTHGCERKHVGKQRRLILSQITESLHYPRWEQKKRGVELERDVSGNLAERRHLHIVQW